MQHKRWFNEDLSCLIFFCDHRQVLEMSIKDSLPSTGLNAREQQKQGCSSREKELGTQGTTPQI